MRRRARAAAGPHLLFRLRLVLTETSENRNDYSEMAAADTVVFDYDDTTTTSSIHTHCAIIQKRLLYGHHPKDAGGVTVTHHCVKSFQVVRAATTRQHTVWLEKKYSHFHHNQIGLQSNHLRHQRTQTYFGPQSFTLLQEDLCQDVNEGFTFSKCLNGTFT